MPTNIIDDLVETNKLSNKVRDRVASVKKNLEKLEPNEFIEPTSAASRHKLKNRETLSLSDKIDIVEKVKFKWVPQKEVAKEFRVSESTVSQLMLKVRR